VLWKKRAQEVDEYFVYAALKRLTDAEERFREGDLDSNGIKDYWTGDLASLYDFGLIDRSMAEADTKPLKPLVSSPVPFRGYLFTAIEIDHRSNSPEPFKSDTDKRSGRVHSLSKFGFCAYPVDPNAKVSVLIVGEDHTVFFNGKVQGAISYWPSTQERAEEGWSSR